jgi:predicted HicB family RNase H-like nuclease
MSIVLHPDLEARLRQKADAAGVSIEAYVERLVLSDQDALG